MLYPTTTLFLLVKRDPFRRSRHHTNIAQLVIGLFIVDVSVLNLFTDVRGDVTPPAQNFCQSNVDMDNKGPQR